MFTGIIEAVGVVRHVAHQPSGRRLAIAAEGLWRGLAPGASVAIDGVCLTLTDVRGPLANFDVIPETLRRTTLGDLAAGHRVNLELALAAGARLDGHFVQGHVDAVATVSRVDRHGDEALWFFALDVNAMKYVIPKGAVAVDGISLTVASVAPREFGVALIPTTLERTTLGSKPPGTRVNIETDILARTVVHAIESMTLDRGGLTLDRLRQEGFA